MTDTENLAVATYGMETRIEFAFGETVVHGEQCYSVEPTGGNWTEMENWALATYGLETGTFWDSKCHRWYMNDRKFIFRNEADRTMFVLKWQ